MESDRDELKLAILEDLNTRVQEILNSATMKSAFQTISNISANMRRIIPIHQEPKLMYIVRQSVTSLEVENILDKKLRGALRKQQISPEEIIFTKDKALIRMVSGKELKHSFFGNRKRIAVFEVLNDATDYISTRELQGYVESPSSQAFRRTIYSINSDVKKALKLKTNIIEGRPGLGYKISGKITVISE
jgi:uncharacterized protein (DUF2267 family)